jgi:TrpR family trp operon transcriptional repressor
MSKIFLNEFIKTINDKSNTKEIEKFLKAILTPKELDEIPKRLQIVKMLKKGLPQREIVEKLGVGVATVTRGSKEIQKGSFKDIE